MESNTQPQYIKSTVKALAFGAVCMVLIASAVFSDKKTDKASVAVHTTGLFE